MGRRADCRGHPADDRHTFNHRDRDEFPDSADRFSPEQWLSPGCAADDWTFNHFSHGPQACPGAALALLVGREMLAKLLREREVKLLEPRLELSKPLPHSLEHSSLRFATS